jgi:hypothetical protein
VLKGLRGDLDPGSFEKRWQLVELLIDRVVVTDGKVEIRHVFPTGRPRRTCPACACSAASVSRSTRGLDLVPDNIDGGRCPVVDTWWSTETGMIMITPLPAVVDTRPGSATFPFPGDGRRHRRQRGASGRHPARRLLVLREPWPAMLCGIYGDPERYKENYWSRFQGCTSPVSRGSISLVQVLSQ